jgi:hypothetical protein
MFIITTLIASSLVTADVRIEQLLPENAIAFATVEDVSSLVSQMQQMGVCDAFCDIAALIWDAGDADLSTFFGTDGECTIPNGQASWGLYPVVDFELGSVGLGMFAMLEADDPALSRNIMQALKKFDEANENEMELIDIGGRDVWSMQADFDLSIDALPIPIDLGRLSNIYFASTDGYILFGTESEGFSTLFSIIDGDATDDSLASNEVYEELMARCGTKGEAYAGVLLTNLSDALMQMDTSGMGMMIMPMIKSLFGDIHGIAQTVTFAPSDDVLLTGTYAILMPNGRDGLTGLFVSDASAVEIPSFVGDDTITYLQNSIAFDKVIPLIKDITASNPLLAMQLTPQIMEQMEMGVSLYLATLGSETHFMTTGTEPYTADSDGYMIAVECINEDALSNVLSMTMPSFGASPTDFLGNQIFTVDLGGGMMIPIPMDLSFSIAVGGGYVFIGSQFSVENALRAVANPKDAKSNHGLNAAASMIKHETVSGWGYGDMGKSMQMQKAVSNSMLGMNEEMLNEIEAFDPEMAAEMRAESESNLETQNAILDAMVKTFGSMAWNINADDTGFMSSVILMKSGK